MKSTYKMAPQKKKKKDAQNERNKYKMQNDNVHWPRQYEEKIKKKRI